jgi:hypothetical protein
MKWIHKNITLQGLFPKLINKEKIFPFWETDDWFSCCNSVAYVLV